MGYMRNILGFFQRSYSIYSRMAVYVYACVYILYMCMCILAYAYSHIYIYIHALYISASGIGQLGTSRTKLLDREGSEAYPAAGRMRLFWT